MVFCSTLNSTSAYDWTLSDTTYKASHAQLYRICAKSFDSAAILSHYLLGEQLQPIRDCILPLTHWRLPPLLLAYLVRIRDICYVVRLFSSSICLGSVHQPLSEK